MFFLLPKFLVKLEKKPVKNDLIKLINLVQDEVRNYFTFNFTFVGSTDRKLITRDVNSNIGYDFDVNLSFLKKRCKDDAMTLATDLLYSKFLPLFGIDPKQFSEILDYSNGKYNESSFSTKNYQE